MTENLAAFVQELHSRSWPESHHGNPLSTGIVPTNVLSQSLRRACFSPNDTRLSKPWPGSLLQSLCFNFGVYKV